METYRSHLEAEGPGMHRDLAFAQVMHARGPLLFDSESVISKKCTQVYTKLCHMVLYG